MNNLSYIVEGQVVILNARVGESITASDIDVRVGKQGVEVIIFFITAITHH